MYSNIKILIVEDEPLIAEALKTYLLHLNLKEIHIEYELKHALEVITNNSFDLVLLDIRMQGQYDGITIGLALSEKQIPFIYITAHSDKDMIKKMSETKASAFISKPVRKEELLLNVTFVLNSILENTKNIITVRSGHDLVPVEKKKLLYLKTDGNYLELYLTNNEKILVRTSIDRFLEEIQDADFLQTHRSYIINKNQLKFLKTDSVVLVSEDVVPVSRTYLNQLRMSLSKN